MPRRDARPLIHTPRGPSRPAWQRLYLGMAAIPGLPQLGWLVARPRRAVLAQALRVVRCAFDYFNRTGSLPRSVFDRTAVTHQAAEVLGTVGTFHGYAGWLELMAEMREAFEGLRLEPERLVAAPPNRVLVRLSARGRASGVSVETPIAIVITLRGGRAGRLDVYRERAAALEELGLSPTLA